MSPYTIYAAVCLFLLFVFLASVWCSFHGSHHARYFLWLWAGMLAMATPSLSFVTDAVAACISGTAGLLLIYALSQMIRSRESVEIAHEETRRVLAEANSRMDDERRRIARRLHDEVNPGLLLARLELQSLHAMIGSHFASKDQAEHALLILTKVTSSLTEAYQECRSIIRHTRIEVIDTAGLTVAIESLVSHYSQILERPSITLRHDLPERPDVPAVVAVNVYRILQEALLNAVKHAEAQRVAVSIRRVGKRFDVMVADDGIGISATNDLGIGLIDMRERARVLKGKLNVEGGRDGGTIVSFSFVPQG